MRAHHRWAAPLGVLAALGLRAYQLGAARLWYDEAFSLILARLPFERMILATAGDTHPPLYYALLWLVYRLAGGAEWVMRLPSLLASLGVIPLLWLIARRLGLSQRAAWLSAGLVAVMPVQIHYAQEARQYALMQLLILLAIWWMLSARPGLAGLAALAALYTHNYTLFYLPVIAAAAWPGMPNYYNHWSQDTEDRFIHALTVGVIVPLLLWLPWVAALAGQMDAIAAGGYWIQPVTAGGIVYTVYMLLWGFAMPEKFQPVAVMLAAGLLAWAGVRAAQRRPPGWGLLLIWAGLPLGLAVAVSLLWRPVLLFRGLLPSSAAICIMAGWALARLDRRRLAVAGLLILPLVAAGLWGYFAHNVANKRGAVAMLAPIRAGWQPGDAIYHINDGSLVLGLAYGPDLPQALARGCQRQPLGALSQATRRALGVELKAQPAGGRYWVIYSAGPTSPACEAEAAAAWLAGAEEIYKHRDDALVYSGVWLHDNP